MQETRTLIFTSAGPIEILPDGRRSVEVTIETAADGRILSAKVTSVGVTETKTGLA
jgi:hypothetical protein